MKLSSGIPFALIAAVGWGLFFFFLVYSVRALGPWVAAWVAEIGVTIAAGVHLALTRQKVALRGAVMPSMIANAFSFAWVQPLLPWGCATSTWASWRR